MLIAGAATVFAQTTVMPAPMPAPGIEITPMVGYRWGGEIPARDTSAVAYTGNLQSNGSWGLAIDIPVTRSMAIELLGDHQRTSLGQDTLFAPVGKHFDLDVNYYHIGFRWQRPSMKTTPFFVASLGVGDLRPVASGFTSAQRFSASVGLGAKVAFGESVAFFIEGRNFWTDTGNTHSSWWDSSCSTYHCNGYWSNYYGLSQFQVNVGLTFLF